MRETQIARNTYGIEVNAFSLAYASSSSIDSNTDTGPLAVGTGAAIVASANVVSMNEYGYYLDTNGGIHRMSNNVVRDDSAQNIYIGASGAVPPLGFN